MKVKELIEKLQQFDKDKEVIIRFALDEDDDIGYILNPISCIQFFNEQVEIISTYDSTKEDCDFIGQVDLREAYKKNKRRGGQAMLSKEEVEKILKDISNGFREFKSCDNYLYPLDTAQYNKIKEYIEQLERTIKTMSKEQTHT